MRKKEIISLAMEKSGFNYFVNRLRRIFDKEQFSILTYHRIFDSKLIMDFKYDEGLISATPEQFDKQIEFLKNKYNIISFSKLLECFEINKKIDNGTIVLAFDDGFEDNYFNAYPILKKYSIPATIFVSVDYIGKRQYFWFDEAILMLKSLSLRSISFLNEEQDLVTKIDISSRGAMIRSVMYNLKRVSNSVRIKLLDMLKEKFVYEKLNLLVEATSDQYLNHPMTWEHVREMSKFNIEFGSHTMTHPILSTLSKEELYYELNESHDILKKSNINYIPVLAYPVGGNYAFNNSVKSIAKDVGYKLACSYMPGRNIINKYDKYAIKRLPVEKFMQMHYISSMLTIPELFFDKK